MALAVYPRALAGFLYIRRDPQESDADLWRRCRGAHQTMLARGTEVYGDWSRPGFVVRTYGKRNGAAPYTSAVADGAVIATGTLGYRGRWRQEAVDALAHDQANSTIAYDEILGAGALLQLGRDSLELSNDGAGLYHLYSNGDGSVVSNVFLAVLTQVNNPSFDTQAVYEYLSFGGVYADETLVRQIRLLNSFHVHRWSDEGYRASHKPELPRPAPLTFDEALEDNLGRIGDYFASLKRAGFDRVSSGLSGGYDSRFMLSILQHADIEPVLYVYGSDDHPDVIIAKQIAAAKGLALDHINKADTECPTGEAFVEAVRASFFARDGRAVGGCLDSGAEVASRTQRASIAPLQVNASGGEIFRDYWPVPDSGLWPHEFLTTYRDVDRSAFGDLYDDGEFFGRMQAKARWVAQCPSGIMSREQVERLYPLLRLRYWMGPNVIANTLFGDALHPLAEQHFWHHTCPLPARYRHRARLLEHMMRRLDPQTAALPSVYGHNFLDHDVDLDPVRRSAPYRTAQALGRRARLNREWLRQRWQRHYRAKDLPATPPMPDYLLPERLRLIFGDGPLLMERYVDLARVRGPLLRNRIYTLELLMRGTFADWL